MKIKTEDILKAFYDLVENQEGMNKDIRLMSIEEIVDANEDMEVDFTANGVIPVFDVFDNDYICYQIKNGKWCLFNTIDEISFKKDSTLQHLFSFLAGEDK